MKRVINVKKEDNRYIFKENEEIVFFVNCDDMHFDVKNFYEAFFEDDKSDDQIELCKGNETDSDTTRIFNLVNELINEIVIKLKENA